MNVSVVIPTYRRPELLIRCLNSLENQAFEKNQYEVIVVSDGPDPATKAAILSLSSQSIKFFQLPEKKGPAAARNCGWKNSVGDLILFTDDDCLPDENWISNFWNAFLQRPYREASFTGRTIVPIPRIPTDYELNISHLATAEFITANCACTRATLINTNGFDEAFTMAWREDSDFQFRLWEKSIPLFHVDEAVVTHPVRKAKWGVCLKEEKKGMFNALLFKKFPDLYRKKIQPHPPWLYYCILFSVLTSICGLLVDSVWLTYSGIGAWFILTLLFAMKRLKATSHDPKHITEMIVTSMAIPFLSLYWRWYGAIKYRTLLI